MTTNELDQVSPTAARIYGTAALLGPVLLLASTVAYITEGEGINHGKLGGTIGVWSCLAFAIAYVGLLRTLERAAPVAAPRLLAVAVIGCAAGVGFSIDAILASEFGREAVDTFTEESGYVLLAYLPWGLFFPISAVATGVLLWRASTYNRASALLMIAGGVLFVAGRPARVDPIALMADVALILAFAPVARAFLTQDRSEPARPRAETAAART